MSVFHCAGVRSVAYRSEWQRLQLMAYNSWPVSFFAAGFLPVSAKASDTTTTEIAATPASVLNNRNRFIVLLSELVVQISNKRAQDRLLAGWQILLGYWPAAQTATGVRSVARYSVGGMPT